MPQLHPGHSSHPLLLHAMLIGPVNAMPVKAEDYQSINFVFIYKELLYIQGCFTIDRTEEK